MHDQNPERRNLLISSLGFLLYFLAGGSLADDVVRIQLINLKFENPTIFVVFAWIILFWFLFRYWLLHSGKFKRDFRGELQLFFDDQIIKKEVERQLGASISRDDKEGPHIGDIKVKKGTLEIRIVWAQKVERKKDTGRIGPIYSLNKKNNPQTILFSGLRGRWAAVKVFMRCFFGYPSFSNYAIPYLAFFAVVVAAVLSLV